MLKTLPHEPILYRKKKRPYKPNNEYTTRQKHIISGKLDPYHVGELTIIMKKARRKNDLYVINLLEPQIDYYTELRLERVLHYTKRQISIIMGKAKPKSRLELNIILRKAEKKNDEDTVFQINKRYYSLLYDLEVKQYTHEEAKKTLEELLDVEILWDKYED